MTSSCGVPLSRCAARSVSCWASDQGFAFVIGPRIRRCRCGLTTESVLFQPKDVSFKRGFEVEYLNPFVFFRPQEYSIGSTDNVFMAAQAAYRFKNKCIYTQVTIDEFDFTQIKNRTRWWANKYGIQLGIKGTKGKYIWLIASATS